MNAKDAAGAPASSSERHISRRDGLKLVGAGMLAARAGVPDLDQDAFDRLAPYAEQHRPVSSALRAEITLDAKLVSR
jgi:hypothetical protein